MDTNVGLLERIRKKETKSKINGESSRINSLSLFSGDPSPIKSDSEMFTLVPETPSPVFNRKQRKWEPNKSKDDRNIFSDGDINITDRHGQSRSDSFHKTKECLDFNSPTASPLLHEKCMKSAKKMLKHIGNKYGYYSDSPTKTPDETSASRNKKEEERKVRRKALERIKVLREKRKDRGEVTPEKANSSNKFPRYASGYIGWPSDSESSSDSSNDEEECLPLIDVISKRKSEPNSDAIHNKPTTKKSPLSKPSISFKSSGARPKIRPWIPSNNHSNQDTVANNNQRRRLIIPSNEVTDGAVTKNSKSPVKVITKDKSQSSKNPFLKYAHGASSSCQEPDKIFTGLKPENNKNRFLQYLANNVPSLQPSPDKNRFQQYAQHSRASSSLDLNKQSPAFASSQCSKTPKEFQDSNSFDSVFPSCSFDSSCVIQTPETPNIFHNVASQESCPRSVSPDLVILGVTPPTPPKMRQRSQRSGTRAADLRKHRTTRHSPTKYSTRSGNNKTIDDDCVQVIEQITNDEDYARKLQEEMDKEFALAIAQNDSMNNPQQVQQPIYPNNRYGHNLDFVHVNNLHHWHTPPRRRATHDPPTNTAMYRRLGIGNSAVDNINVDTVDGFDSHFGVNVFTGNRGNNMPIGHMVENHILAMLEDTPPRRGRRRGARRQPRNFYGIQSPIGDGNDYEDLLQLAEQMGDVQQKGLRNNQINRLPTTKYSKSDQAKKSNESEECSICMCDYEENERLRILPCFHNFHTGCVDKWLKSNASCPVCRVEVRLD